MSASGNPLPPADLDKLKEHMNTMMRSGNPLPEEIQALINSAIKKRSEQDEKEKAKKASHDGQINDTSHSCRQQPCPSGLETSYAAATRI
jgi:hypothetical protein